ncbi:MAG: cupredoxin domain-containing protein [Xanthobacteraceae bacterium]
MALPGTAVMVRAVAQLCLLTIFALCLGAAAPEPVTVTVNMTMIDYKFEPDHLTLQHGVHYRLHLENHGKETHELTAPLFFATAKIDNPDVLNRERSEVVMQPGDVKDLFLSPGKPGTYDLRCADHDWNGMVGGITVE